MRQVVLGIAMAVTAVIAPSSGAAAQAVDLSGSWALHVTTDRGVATPVLMLDQDGDHLTGCYTSDALGVRTITGSVDGTEVTLTLFAEARGLPVPVRYVGTVHGDSIAGTVDVADGMLSGAWVARRTTPGHES